MDTYGVYERTSTNRRTGKETTDEVTLQADPVNRARFEAKGYTFKEAAPTPGVTSQERGTPATQSAAVQIFGWKGGERPEPLSVEEATEVVLRKIAGTWTQEEAVAEGEAEIAASFNTDGVTDAPVGGAPKAPAPAPNTSGKRGSGAAAVTPPAS